jgi:uncharacterized protein
MDVNTIKSSLIPVLKDFNIRYVALFGSVARGEQSSDSDIDLLVDIGHPMGMIQYMRFIYEVEDVLQVIC